MRVLIIEDDDDIRSVLERGLEGEGFSVDSAADGNTGFDLAVEGGHAAIVLDLLLPGQSGYHVCDAIRAEGITTPILVLTAKAGEYDQIDLLDAGADDFLSKPVSIALVAARLRALIRRGAALADNSLVRGSLQYDLASRQCLVDHEPVSLTAREDQLLRRLLIANGAYVRRDDLLSDVWGPESGVDGSILDIYLRRLREKIAPAVIGNARGQGYRIETTQA